MGKLIYLCGAMGCYDNPDDYKRWRTEFFEREFKNVYDGHASVFDPTEFYSYENKLHKSESEIMEYELYHIRKSDLIVVNLDRICESVGSIMEIATAKCSSIPIVAFGNADGVHPWILECIMRLEDDMDSLIQYIDKYLLNV